MNGYTKLDEVLQKRVP